MTLDPQHSDQAGCHTTAFCAHVDWALLVRTEAEVDAVNKYPLSPLQQGMLFHTLSEPQSGVDIEQILCTLPDPFRPTALSEAWRRVTERHEILRTRFQWADREIPEQAVEPHATLPITVHDWRHLDQSTQETRRRALLEQDRFTDFDMDRAPLMRLAVLRLNENKHQWLWTFHHALLDGRSFPIVLKEVFAFYDAHQEPTSPVLARPRPYRDFITWLTGRDAEHDRAYWTRTLKGFRAPTPLRTPTPPPDAPKKRGTNLVSTRLPNTECETLEHFAAAHDLTLNTLIQGAWALLLYHYSGESDVVFGATRACRHTGLEGSQDMVGLFINTLPVRLSIAPEEPLLAWLKRLRAQHVALRAHEHASLADVQRLSDLPPGTPLFDTLVVFEKYLLQTLLRTQGGPWTDRAFVYRGQTNFPLTLVATRDDGLLLNLEYKPERFGRTTIERLGQHLSTLLRAMPSSARTPLAAVPYMPHQERRQLVVGWNPPFETPAMEETLHRRFERQVDKHPEAMALSFEDHHLSYAELNRRANRLAHRLRALRVPIGPDSLVGLCVERSLDTVVGILGILKAGAAYLPLDPDYPEERLAFTLSDAHAEVVVTQKRVVHKLPQESAHVVLIDEASREFPDHNLDAGATSDHLAYVIYTSGSTGRPKGVLIAHEQVLRLFDATESWFGFGKDDVWTLFHSFAFDFSVWEIWGALLYGGRVVVVPYWVSRSPDAFYTLLHKERVTSLSQTPSAFKQLIAVDATKHQTHPLSLRTVVFGGEALELQSLAPWFERHGDAQPKLVNMYGITETTVHVTYRALQKDDLKDQPGSLIGRPIPDLSVYVLNPFMQPVPVGVPGELFVGGAGLARGYLGRPRLTEERFVSNPFSDRPGSRLYKTGDLARFLPNGELEYLGRTDHQVKIRGFRIELGEIEALLNGFPKIREALVLAREDAPGDKRLVAYFTYDKDAPGSDDLRAYLNKALPSHMIPAAFVALDAFPLTSNKKKDRRALPPPAKVAPGHAEDFVPPQTEKERILADIWCEVLDLPQAGLDDNFFSLGGDSILTIHVVTKARARGLKFTPKQLFLHPTLRSLAHEAEQVSDGQGSQQGQGSVEGTCPLTPIQHWFFDQQLADQDHYNQAFLFECNEPLERDLVERTLRHIVAQHDTLRLRFHKVSSTWVQSFQDAKSAYVVEEIFVSESQEPARGALITQHAAACQGQLNIHEGPLIMAALFRLGKDEPERLLLAIHHLAVDGVSWQILMEDFEHTYGALRAGKKPTLPPKTSSFKAWAEALTEYAKTDGLHQELPHWSATESTTRLPVDYGEPRDNTEASLGTVTVSLSKEKTEALLKDVPSAFQTHINDVLLLALLQALQAWTGQESIGIDLEGHGREDLFEHIDLSRTLGWFTTIFPVKLSYKKGRQHDRSLARREALKAVKEQLRKIPKKGLGHGVLTHLAPRRAATTRLSALSRPELVFNYLGQFDQVVARSQMFRFAKESTGPWHSPRAQRKYPLEVLAVIKNKELVVEWGYSRNIHKPETIKRVAEDFLTHLKAIIEDCTGDAPRGFTPSDFPLAKLDQRAIDAFLRQSPNLEDIYPLSPMQRLFHSLDSSDQDVGFDQWYYTLEGPLDVPAFKEAWNRVAHAHTILRSSFASQGTQDPLQIVHRDIRIPWTEVDLRERPPKLQASKFADFLEKDRAQGFDLSVPPLMRMALIRMGDETTHVVWSHHHLHIDGWSWPIVLNEVRAAYVALKKKKDVKPATSQYGTYISWLDAQNEELGAAFWEEFLRGFSRPTPLVGARLERVVPASKPGPTQKARFGTLSRALTQEQSEALRTLSKSARVTLNTVVQGAWALLVSAMSHTRDIVFGAAFSGRPPELLRVDTMVGPFVNNLPLRTKIPSSGPLVPWLASLHQTQMEVSQHQHTPLPDIQKASRVPWRNRLFQSLVVFQNYKIDDASMRLSEDVRFLDFVAPIRTNYPLTVVVRPQTCLAVDLLFETGIFDQATMEAVLEGLLSTLSRMARHPTPALNTLMEQLPAFRAGRVPSTVEQQPRGGRPLAKPRSELEKTIAQVWQEVFQLEQVGVTDNFSDFGVQSIVMLEVLRRLRTKLNRDLSIVNLFQYPTVQKLATFLGQERPGDMANESNQDRGERQRKARQRFARKRR